MPASVSKNQKLANAALKSVMKSRQYFTFNALPIAHAMALAAHGRSGRSGPGPTFNQVYKAALNYNAK